MKKPEGALQSIDEVEALLARAKQGEIIHLYEVYRYVDCNDDWELYSSILDKHSRIDRELLFVKECKSLSKEDCRPSIELDEFFFFTTWRHRYNPGNKLFTNFLLALGYYRRLKAERDKQIGSSEVP